MKKKLIMVLLIGVIFITGCGRKSPEDVEKNDYTKGEIERKVQVIDSDFKLIDFKVVSIHNDKNTFVYNVYDKRTMVRYILTESETYYGYSGGINISHKVNEDGTPVLYEKEKEKEEE